jgi:hypothetical protein
MHKFSLMTKMSSAEAARRIKDCAEATSRDLYGDRVLVSFEDSDVVLWRERSNRNNPLRPIFTGRFVDRGSQFANLEGQFRVRNGYALYLIAWFALTGVLALVGAYQLIAGARDLHSVIFFAACVSSVVAGLLMLRWCLGKLREDVEWLRQWLANILAC